MAFFLFILFFGASAGAAAYAADVNVAVYTLSFWHYYLYWLAYRFGAVSLSSFKRDAILMKSVSMASLGWAFLSTSSSLLSVCVVMLGFTLNAYSAFVLGSNRTYYGYEIGAVSESRITSFPYSITAHPMLIGNMIAFGGTLIDPDFRHEWWPLAIAHVAMNFGLLIMETKLSPGAGRSFRSASEASRYFFGFIGLTLSAVMGCFAPEPIDPVIGASLSVAIFVYAFSLHSLYCSGISERSARHNVIHGSVR